MYRIITLILFFSTLFVFTSTSFATPITSFPANITGALATTDGVSATLASSVGNKSTVGNYADRYEISVTPGQQLTIDMNTTSFDGYLNLLSSTGTVLASNDDSGSTLRSLINYTATTAGVVTIEATSYSSGITGSYTLNVTSVGGTPTNSASITSFPANITGALATTDIFSTTRVSNYADSYNVSVTPGQQLTIDMNTTTFDGYLNLLSSTGAVLASNDDYGSTLRSLINYTSTVADVVTIEATSYASGTTGSYTLNVTSVGGTTTTGARVLTLPSNISGTLASTDPIGRAITGAPANIYTVSLTAGQTIVIDQSSTVFDAYLSIYDATGTQLASNDDYGGTLNSHISYTATLTGTYTIEATSLGSGIGAYTLTASLASATSVPVITASFNAPVLSGVAPLSVSPFSLSYSSSTSDTLSYSWDFGDSSPLSTLAAPTYTYQTAGTYSLTLTVRNASGQSGVFSRTVTVQPAATTLQATFTTPSSVYQANIPISFTGSATPIPSLLSGTRNYSWSWGDGQSSTGVNPTHTYLTAGNYTVNLTVADSTSSQQGTYTRTLTVQPSTSAGFTVSYRTSPASPGVSETVSFVSQITFANSASVPSITYSWDFGDGTTSTGLNPNHAFSRTGSFVTRLTATDTSTGQSSSTSQTITVLASTLTARFTANATTGYAPLAVNFTNSSSSTNSSDTLTYSWNFGDGQTSTSSTPNHTYTTAGTYSATLTVHNTAGATATSIPQIIEVSGGNIPVTGRVTLRPQVLMAGFDPILVDLADTSFKLVAIVRPGATVINNVVVGGNAGGFSMAMNSAGVYSNGDQRYETQFVFPRGSFPTNTVLGDLFGSATSQFRMTVYDVAQQTHSFPNLESGNNVALTRSVTSPGAQVSSTPGTVRLFPQVLMSGFDPQLIDLGDTSFDIVAIVRAGAVPIQSVAVSQNQGGFSRAMNLYQTLPNGDTMYKSTFTFARGAFGSSRFGDLFGTRAGQFNITVTDQAQQTHSFPQLGVGNYPAL